MAKILSLSLKKSNNSPTQNDKSKILSQSINEMEEILSMIEENMEEKIKDAKKNISC